MTENSPTPSLPPAKPLQGFPETAAQDARLALIRAYQAHALRQPDPLAANLAVINGDLMELVYRLRQALDGSASGSPAAFPELAHQVEVLLPHGAPGRSPGAAGTAICGGHRAYRHRFVTGVQGGAVALDPDPRGRRHQRAVLPLAIAPVPAGPVGAAAKRRSRSLIPTAVRLVRCCGPPPSLALSRRHRHPAARGIAGMPTRLSEGSSYGGARHWGKSQPLPGPGWDGLASPCGLWLARTQNGERDGLALRGLDPAGEILRAFSCLAGSPRWLRGNENSLENADRSAGGWPLIIESAGEPRRRAQPRQLGQGRMPRRGS